MTQPGSEIGFGLATAGGAGTADFLAKTTTDRVGFYTTLWYLELFGAPVLVALALLVAGLRPLPLVPFLETVGLAVLSFVGILFLYRAFERGRLAVVAPLTSGYPVLIVALSLLVLHEPLTPLAAGGIGAVLVGSVVLAGGAPDPGSPVPRARAGVASAALAFVAFGLFNFGLKFVIGPVPPTTAAAITRLVGLALATGLGASVHALRLPPREIRLRAVGFPIVDSLALVAYSLGVAAAASIAILGTVSGLYGAVTLAWAVVLLKDRLGRRRGAGALLIFAGIALLAVSGV